MFENFPYTDMHQLNLDWIIKIAKDFLDQYTHIQQLIADGEESLENLTTEGLAELQAKADEITGLLNAWYSTHSTDIANQLASALSDINGELASAITAFNTAAAAKAAETIESIPDDYTDLFNSALKASQILVTSSNVSNYSNVANYPINKIVTVLPNAGSIVGAPYDDIGFTIISTGYHKNPDNVPYGGEIQIAIPTFDLTHKHFIKYRSYNGTDWSGWSYDVSSFIRSTNEYVENTSVYSSVHDFPNNSIILVKNRGTNNNLQDRPYPYQDFYIITTGHSTLTTLYAGKLQIAIPFNSNDHSIKFSSYNGTSWTEWSIDFNVSIIKPKGYITNATAYPDIDLVPINTIIGFNNNANILHRPFADPFILYTTGIDGTQVQNIPAGGEIQIAIPFYKNSGSLKWRVYDGSAWDDWYPNVCEISVNPTNWIDEIMNKQDQYSELIVHMTHGVYNMFDTTHNEAYWKAHRKATRYMGLCLKNTKIIGDNNMYINAKYTGNDSDIKENFSCFCIMDNVTLDNLKVEAQNICYIVHDDTPIVSITKSRAIVKNCTFKHSGTANHTYDTGAPICYGAGFSEATYREIINNIFSNTDRNFAVSFHTATNSNGKAIISGNYFDNSTLRLAPMGSGGVGDIVFSNNKINDAIINLSSEFTVYAWNNPTT